MSKRRAGQRVIVIGGEYRGYRGVVRGIIPKRYGAEDTVICVQLDGFGKVGGWDGKIRVSPSQLKDDDVLPTE